MRIARVIGNLTLSTTLPGFPAGSLLFAEALDGQALAALPEKKPRKTPMPEALVVFDQLGAGVGQHIGISEGREASMPFWPEKVPVDAYCSAILDTIELTR